MIEMLEKPADTAKYVYDQNISRAIASCYSSKVFGGPVMRNVANRANCLDELIKHCQVDYLSGGGYYTIKQVKITAQSFCDVWLLIPSIKDFESLKKLKAIVDQERKNVSFTDISKLLNGYGRIIHYHSNGGFSPSNLTIISVNEG